MGWLRKGSQRLSEVRNRTRGSSEGREHWAKRRAKAKGLQLPRPGVLRSALVAWSVLWREWQVMNGERKLGPGSRRTTERSFHFILHVVWATVGFWTGNYSTHEEVGPDPPRLPWVPSTVTSSQRGKKGGKRVTLRWKTWKTLNRGQCRQWQMILILGPLDKMWERWHLALPPQNPSRQPNYEKNIRLIPIKGRPLIFD